VCYLVSIVQGSRGMLGLVEYSFINTRSYTEVDAESLAVTKETMNKYMDAVKKLAASEPNEPHDSSDRKHARTAALHVDITYTEDDVKGWDLAANLLHRSERYIRMIRG
jgi:hypothetical protein